MPQADAFEAPQGGTFYGVLLESITEALIGNGIQNDGDGEVTAAAGTDMGIEVAGVTDLRFGGTSYTVSADSFTLSDGPTTTTGGQDDRRADLVIFDSSLNTGSGGFRVIEGTADPNPTPAAVPADSLLLAVVEIPHEATNISDTEILNWRAHAAIDFQAQTADLADLSIVTAKVADGAIVTAKIADGDVTTAKLDTDAVTNPKVANDAIDTAQVAADAITDSEIDLSITPTWSGEHTFSGGITGLPTPTADSDAATKAYVDAAKAGLDVKDSVRAATDGSNIDLTSATDPNPIDGVTLSDGDRVLLMDQTAASENGIYDAVTATDPTTWVRSSDADEDDEVTAGLFTFVAEGTSNGDNGYAITTDDPITVGTTAITFAIFSGSGADTHTAISDDGSTVVSETDDINFRDGLDATDDGDGTVTVDYEHREVFEGRESGSVSAGNQGILIIDHLADTESVEVYKAVLTNADGSAVATSVDLKLVTLDNAGAFTSQATLITGDGSTVFDDETGAPLGSYTNTTGSGQTIGVLVDNQTAGSVDIMAAVEGVTGA